MNFLERYINALDLVMLPEQKVLVVGLGLHFCYLSPAIKSEYGVITESNQYNSYTDLPPLQQLAISCHAEDELCLHSKKPQQYITSQNHNGAMRLFLKYKTPVIDHLTEECVGVRTDFMPILSLGRFKPYLDKHMVQQVQSKLKLEKHEVVDLTKTEELVLFLLIMYLKPKTVTLHLNKITGKDVATSTIRNIIHQQLFKKFNVNSPEALIDKALFMGYDAIFPRVIAEQFSLRIM